MVALVCFFFQAEDGIRDVAVTGVQTCALPISDSGSPSCAPPVVSGPAPGGCGGAPPRPTAGSAPRRRRARRGGPGEAYAPRTTRTAPAARAPAQIGRAHV